MLKALGKLWLGGATRLAKAQARQQKRLQKALIKQLLPVATKPRAAAKKSRAVTRTRIKRGAVAATAAVAAAATSAMGAAVSAALSPPERAAPGKARRARKASPVPVAPLPPASGPGAGGSWSRAYVSSRLLGVAGPARRLIYWLYVPYPGAEGKRPRPLPLVVMLHGCEQDALDFASGTRMNALAARHGFAVLYPQQSASAHPQRCWPWYKRSVQQGGDEVALIAGAIDKVIAGNDIDRSRVYVAGLSAGAALAQILALQRPQLIAAVASHSGPVYGVADSRLRAFGVMQHGSFEAVHVAAQMLGREADFPAMPILVMQGEQDPVVRPVNARQLVQQFCLLNRLPATAQTPPQLRAARGACDAYRTTDYRRDGKTLVRLCEVAHLGHAWSGGDASLRYNAAAGPDASALMWNFFRQHRRVQQRAHAGVDARGAVAEVA